MPTKRETYVQPPSMVTRLGPFERGVHEDLKAVESSVAVLQATSGAVKPRSTLTVTSPHTDVLPWLPPREAAGRIRTVNRIWIDASTSFPRQVTWTEPTLLSIVVQNPSGSGVNLNVGYGLYGNQNHQGQPVVIPPGSEFVGNASPLPLFARWDSGARLVTVITERAAQ